MAVNLIQGKQIATASWSQNAVTASYATQALSASWAPTQNIHTSSFATTGSNIFIGNQVVTGSVTATQGFTTNWGTGGTKTALFGTNYPFGVNNRQILFKDISNSDFNYQSQSIGILANVEEGFDVSLGGDPNGTPVSSNISTTLGSSRIENIEGTAFGKIQIYPDQLTIATDNNAYEQVVQLKANNINFLISDKTTTEANTIELYTDRVYTKKYITTDQGFIGNYLEAPSITGSLFGTASFAISASWAPTQNNSSGSNLDSLGGVSIRTIYSRNSDTTYTAGVNTNVDFMSGSTTFGSRVLPQSFFDESVNFKGKILHFRTVGKFASGGSNDTDAIIYLAIGDHTLSGSNLGKQDIDFSSNKPFEILGELIITAGSSSVCYSIAWCDQTGDLRRTPLGDVTVSESFANITPGEFKIIISGSTTRNMTTYYSYFQVYN